MTQIISENLYLSLIKNRDEQIAAIAEREASIVDLTAEIKDDEQFLADFDTIIAGFEATIASLTTQVASLQTSIDENEAAQNTNTNNLEAALTALEGLQETLSSVQETGTPAQIAAAQAAVDAKQEEVDQLEATQSDLEAQETSLKNQKASSLEAKTVAEKDKDDANNRKTTLEGGELQENKDKLDDLKVTKAQQQSDYDTWIATNGPLIASFEEQQGFRDEVIRLTDNRNNYDRPRSQNVNDLLYQEDTAVKQVILTDLDEGNLTEAEKALRTEAINQGKNKETLNPDYLSSQEAAEMARAARFSTREVASAIKAAAMRGDFSTSVPRLADTTVYALQQAGYSVYLTSQSNDAFFKIDWSNISSSGS